MCKLINMKSAYGVRIVCNDLLAIIFDYFEVERLMPKIFKNDRYKKCLLKHVIAERNKVKVFTPLDM